MDIFFSTLLVIVFSFIFSSISKLLLRRKQSNNLPPSPPRSLPLLGHLHLINQPLHRSLAALSTSYGPVLSLRFGSRPVLLISSPSAAEDCLSKNDTVFANRPHLISGKYFGYNHSTIVVSSYGAHWRNLRRIATVELLSAHRVQSLSAIRAQEVRSLVKALFRNSERGKSVVELKSRLSELTYNVAMGMIADKRYYGENVTHLEEAKRFRRIVEEALSLGSVSNLADFLPVMGWIDFGGVVRKMKGLAKERDEILQGLIDEEMRKKKKIDDLTSTDEGKGVESKRKTLIQVLLSLQEAEPER